jgi:molecular chaperone DnaK
MKLGEAMYKANAGASAGESSDGPEPAAGGEGVVDADFEEVDGDKKE